MDEDKCLTIKDNKAVLGTFNNGKNQLFEIHEENGKYAFVCAENNSGLCIFQDKQDNAAEIITDGGKHSSSWFTLSRAEKGHLTNKAYLIKTHANGKALDVAGGKPEDCKKILQYNIHQNDNQLWWLEPVEDEKAKGKNKKKAKRPKKQPKKPEYADVPLKVDVNDKDLFKVYSILNKNFVFTVNKDGKVVLNKHHNKPDQHFHVLLQGNKFAFADKKSANALCIYQDNNAPEAPIITDGSKHNSSWF
jgi:hypothetical protein